MGYIKTWTPVGYSVIFWIFRCVHPGRLTWNMRIHPWKGKIIFQTIIFRFYVNLPVCSLIILSQKTLDPGSGAPTLASCHRRFGQLPWKFGQIQFGNGKFTYIWVDLKVNVGKYTSAMHPMGPIVIQWGYHVGGHETWCKSMLTFRDFRYWVGVI